ncbi:MlaE family lipid ABC transporter permease subunit [Cognatishimia sp. F0-27]|uniref:ABC transporter permease n=1 Tax=Cognatishimia sp. F0-27 TaxID=2816855 RepID=UPI001D0C380B|nr:MlaE family lipid ABC transporter permease subunit [Cognatishimia sp. F0-27]MCC1493750.1 MlaE family lipid ABC transporter permease subunit [Cognatishimia sp. F0-27]
MTQTASPQITVMQDASPAVVSVRGDLTLMNVTRFEADLQSLPTGGDLRLDLGGAERLDTAAAWSIAMLRRRLEARGDRLVVDGADEAMASLLDTVDAAIPTPDVIPPEHRTVADRLAELGERVAGGGRYLLALVGYLGLFLSRMAGAITHPRSFRLTALVHHCEEVGVKAVPIVALMAFLIGVVLAFQGASQLQQFGAEVFVVDLIAISILRELGILLTSIIVAGRTASAYTAAIGSMKMREEIDAMRSLGLDPASMLFVPRILALVLMLPILGLIANLMGLIGGGIMAWIELGISPAMFAIRLVEGTSVDHVFIGMVKAPVFALLIGIIGCQAGMQVKSNAESLGRMTSSAVVAAIFAVIVADALFSIFFAQIGM